MKTLESIGNMNKLIHFLENSYLNLISGLVGAIAWSLYKKQNLWVAIRNIISGSLASVFLTPTVAEILKLNENFLSFIIGIVGMTLIEEIFVKNKDKIINALKAAFSVMVKR